MVIFLLKMMGNLKIYLIWGTAKLLKIARKGGTSPLTRSF